LGLLLEIDPGGEEVVDGKQASEFILRMGEWHDRTTGRDRAPSSGRAIIFACQ